MHGIKFRLVSYDKTANPWIFLSLRPTALDTNCSSTILMLHMFADILSHGRIDAIADGIFAKIEKLSAMVSAVALAEGGVVISTRGRDLTVSSSGLVNGIQVMARWTHTGTYEAFKTSWTQMHESGLLIAPWSENSELPLRDLVAFCFRLTKTRAASRKKPWKGVTLSVFQPLLNGTLQFLSEILHVTVWRNLHEYEGKELPLRRGTPRLFGFIH